MHIPERRPAAGAFTLIELMVVVAIIAIVAAIALPNMLESRMQANESNVVAALRAYAAAQHIWQKANYSEKGNQAATNKVPKIFCDSYTQLHDYAPGGRQINLIPAAFGAATPTGTPYQGYWFHNPWHLDAHCHYEFCLYAVPVMYARTGVNTFYIATPGQVYGKDFGTQRDPADRFALDAMNPADPAENWFQP